MNQLLVCLSLMVPLSGALLICLSGKLPNLRDAITLVTSIALFVVVCLIYTNADLPNEFQYVLAEPVPGISIAFHVEALGLLFALIASSLWIVTSVYSIAYMRANNETRQTQFYAFFALSLASTMAIAFSANMFTLFLFYEFLTLLTYPLVTHRGTEEAKHKGRVYLGILLATSIALQLTSIIWTWSITQDVAFKAGGVFATKNKSPVLLVIYLLFLFGVGKAALMPFHRWLPAAMVAPAPVSALLHAVAVVKAGVFSIIKVTVYLFGIDTISGLDLSEYLYLIPAFTIIAASIIALKQDNLKARLAYSTISQLSYVILATLFLAPISIVAAALHILAHAFGKITLFFAAGAIYTASKKLCVSELNGIGKRMPVTMLAFTIGSLSMIGIPPTAGFISKWFMLESALSIENWCAIFVIIISTLLNAAYYLPIIYVAFFKQETVPVKINHGEAPVLMVSSLLFVAFMTVIIFCIPNRAIQLTQLIGL